MNDNECICIYVHNAWAWPRRCNVVGFPSHQTVPLRLLLVGKMQNNSTLDSTLHSISAPGKAQAFADPIYIYDHIYIYIICIYIIYICKYATIHRKMFSFGYIYVYIIYIYI